MNPIEPTEIPRLLWTCREAATALGISERKLWDLTNNGAIPSVKIGRAERYDPADIQTWINTQKNRARPSDTTAELP
jgi:excisionase family DNA binding protein